MTRNELLRRRLAEQTKAGRVPVSAADFDRFSEVFTDLADPEVMAAAWH
ncbi:hypothetical protein [Mycobacterium haemophilum]|nr:hypothetical protein [Mycobacterium haemophilum]